jgi:hypothetical protein
MAGRRAHYVLDERNAERSATHRLGLPSVRTEYQSIRFAEECELNHDRKHHDHCRVPRGGVVPGHRPGHHLRVLRSLRSAAEKRTVPNSPRSESRRLEHELTDRSGGTMPRRTVLNWQQKHDQPITDSEVGWIGVRANTAQPVPGAFKYLSQHSWPYSWLVFGPDQIHLRSGSRRWPLSWRRQRYTHGCTRSARTSDGVSVVIALPQPPPVHCPGTTNDSHSAAVHAYVACTRLPGSRTDGC